MARINFEEVPKEEIVETDLQGLIKQYALNKAELDSYDKLCKDENKDIKEKMKEQKLTECPAGDYIAKYSVQHRTTMNEDKLLNLLQSSTICFDKGLLKSLGIIQTKEYINFDNLESAIYNEKLPKELIIEMDKCKDVKDVEVLKVSKVKKKKQEEQ